MSSALCPRFHKAIELVGGRWTGAILRMLMDGPHRFAELREAVPSISDRMLSERLHVLEQEGVVTRAVLPDPPIRVEYALTQKGQELHMSLDAVARWAERWISPDEVSPAAAPLAPPAPRRLRRSFSRRTTRTARRPSGRA
jgi:DNA-binding HxlR family transcriptional regulator